MAMRTDTDRSPTPRFCLQAGASSADDLFSGQELNDYCKTNNRNTSTLSSEMSLMIVDDQ